MNGVKRSMNKTKVFICKGSFGLQLNNGEALIGNRITYSIRMMSKCGLLPIESQRGSSQQSQIRL